VAIALMMGWVRREEMGRYRGEKCVDHIDNNSLNNRLDNLQVMLKEAHSYKSVIVNQSVRRGLANMSPARRMEMCQHLSQRVKASWEGLSDVQYQERRAAIRRGMPRKIPLEEHPRILARVRKGEAIAALARSYGRPYSCLYAIVRRYDDQELNHEIVSIRDVGREDVYDMEVEGYHNFVANGVVIHNSRHPAKSRIDEIELIDYQTLKEGLSMSQSKGCVPATDVFASTRKWGGGTMTRLLNEAGSRGIAVRPYCVYEVAQRCTRECRNDPIYGDCPIYTRQEIQLDGTIAEVPFCYGRLHDVPGGWLPVDDVIQKGMLLDKETWEVQWENKRPTALKRVYPTFHKERHTMSWGQFREVTGYERPPADWPRVAGLDLGSVFAYGLAATDPEERWWWVGEFYDEGQLSTKQRGEILRNRLLYWDGLLVIADPAQKQERQDLLVEARIVTQPAIKDVMLGIN
jgi:hypothetical protein